MLIAGNDSIPNILPPNEAPEWTATPNTTFAAGVGGTDDLKNDVSDPEDDTLTFSLNGASAALPANVTLASNGVITATSSVTEGTTTGILVDVDDGNGNVVTSPSFSISISATSSTLSYPLTATSRIGNKAVYSTGAQAATERQVIGQHDMSIHFGGIGAASTQQMDEDPPGTNYISRSQTYSEVLAGHHAGEHILFPYLNCMETSDNPGIKADKINAETGANGASGWWVRDSSGNKVAFFPGSYGINLSDHIVKDAGETFAEWYSDNVLEPLYFDVMDAAGVQIGGLGGVHAWWDNFQYHSNKSGADWNGIGGNDDAQDYYDSENPAHVAADPVATNAYSTFRANHRLGLERVATNQGGQYDPVSNPSGIILGANTNQWVENYGGPVSGIRADIIKEYRKTGTTDKTFIGMGMSENMTDSLAGGNVVGGWMGIEPNGDLSSFGGSWVRGYNNIIHLTGKMDDPAYHMTVDLGAVCAERDGTSPNGFAVYSHDPAPTTTEAMYDQIRWLMVTCWLAGSHVAISGYEGWPAGSVRSTIVFDEYGFRNTGTTKLFPKWMGQPLEPIQTAAKDNHATGEWWWREYENALILLTTNNDKNSAAQTVPVSSLPGGTSEWKRFNGVQSSANDGSDYTSDSMGGVAGRILVRKSWYNAL